MAYYTVLQSALICVFESPNCRPTCRNGAASNTGQTFTLYTSLLQFVAKGKSSKETRSPICSCRSALCEDSVSLGHPSHIVTCHSLCLSSHAASCHSSYHVIPHPKKRSIRGRKGGVLSYVCCDYAHEKRRGLP